MGGINRRQLVYLSISGIHKAEKKDPEIRRIYLGSYKSKPTNLSVSLLTQMRDLRELLSFQ
jgi:hypothetical protein